VKTAWRTHAALFVVQVAFASGAVEGKIAMMPRAEGGCDIPTEAIAMSRMLGAALFFQVLARGAGGLAATTRRDQAWLALLSVLGIALNQTLFLLGLRWTTPATAALLSITIPVFTAALAILFRQEHPSARTGIGLALAASGVAWLTGVQQIDKGAMVITINCLSYSAYIVLSRRMIQRLGAITVVAWIFAWGALLFAPVGIPALAASLPGWDTRAWGYVGFIVAVPTIIAYSANAWALGRSSATLVTVYIYAQPVMTALLAYVQLGHGLGPRLLVAAAFIAVGVGIVATRGQVSRALAQGG
jgi:drug/metabolite transporter (DMT)-like permease